MEKQTDYLNSCKNKYLMTVAHIHDKNHARDHVLKPTINNIFRGERVDVFILKSEFFL